MMSFFDVRTEFYEFAEGLDRQYSEMVAAASETGTHAVFAHRMAQQSMKATFPEGLQDEPYSIGRKTLEWLEIERLYLEKMQEATVPVANQRTDVTSSLPEYQKLHAANVRLVEGGDYWIVNMFPKLVELIDSDDLKLSLAFGRFNPIDVSEQAQLLPTLSTMAQILYPDVGYDYVRSDYEDTDTEFELPGYHTKVAVSRTTRDADTTYTATEVDKASNVTITTLHEEEDRLWGLVRLPNQTRLRLSGQAALEAAHRLTPDQEHTLAITKFSLPTRISQYAESRLG